MTEIIEAYYQEHKAVFNEKFQIVLESFDVEAIHKMRTSTKRLRALFLLIESLTEKKFKAKKQLNKIRTLFKFAGKIREIQIEKQRVIEYETLLDQNYPEYFEYLKQREHQEISRFLKHLPGYTKRKHILNEKKILNTINSLPKEKIKKQTEKYIQSKQSIIASLISKHESNHRIHANRTHIKQVYYLYDILAHLTSFEKIMGINKERLREIEQYFGTWHDLVNSPVYMNAFFRTKKFTGENKYGDLKKRIAEERRKMRKEITKNLYVEMQV